MNYHYCEGWFRAKKRALAEISPQEAMRRHRAGGKYSVLVGGAVRPVSFLEITNGFVGVGFLDEHLRETLSYQFNAKQPGQLFLSMATWRDFHDATDTVESGITYIFDISGKVEMTRERFNPHSADKSEGVFDPSGNWEPWPEFGEYGPLIKPERLDVR